MDVVLIILGILGFGAIVIAAYVFTVAARTYVSAEDNSQRKNHAPREDTSFVERSPRDRRSGSGDSARFPLNVDGVVIAEDRRRLPDRRKAA
jgi:hypothetical protein